MSASADNTMYWSELYLGVFYHYFRTKKKTKKKKEIISFSSTFRGGYHTLSRTLFFFALEKIGNLYLKRQA